MMKRPCNKVRIIGGDFRRRLLAFPVLENLRPTPNRVRETVFNWLGQELSTLGCLDLFAGSGALGFEAASRGARQVVMVEVSRCALAALRANQVLLAASSVEIVAMDAFHYLESAKERFNIVFLDPPYKAGFLPQLLRRVRKHLHSDALVYIEAREWPVLFDWEVVRRARSGLVQYGILTPKC